MKKLKEKLEDVEGDLVEMEAQYESACLEAQERGKKIFDLSKKNVQLKEQLRLSQALLQKVADRHCYCSLEGECSYHKQLKQNKEVLN